MKSTTLNISLNIPRCLLGGFLVLLLDFPVYAQQQSLPSSVSIPRVMMLVFQPRTVENERIVENVQSHMFEVDVKFGARWVVPEVAGHEARQAYAERLLRSEQLQLVIYWEETTSDVLYYLLPNATAPMQREIVYAWETSRSDAIAIISRTAVESLLDTGQLGAATEAPAPVLKPTAPRVKKTKPTAKTSEPPGRRHTTSLKVQLGYELAVPSSTPTLLHSGMLRVSLSPLAYLSVFVGGGISSELVSSEAGIEMRQRRFPLEVGVIGLLQQTKMTFGVGGAFVMVPVKNDAKAVNVGAVLKNPYWSQGTMLKMLFEFEYRMTPKIALYADLTLLILLNKVTYEVQEGPVLFDEFRRWWPGFQAGVTIYLF